MKKQYRVYVTMGTFLECDIDAENIEDAWVIAKKLDGIDFTEPDQYSGSWIIDNIYELDESGHPK